MAIIQNERKEKLMYTETIGVGVPTYYDHINAANSIVTPSTVHVSNTGLARFFKRYLLQKAMSVFKWELPDTWASNYFLYCLYCWGYVGVINTNKYGVIPQACGLRGYDVMYQPTNAIITNPLLKGMLEPRIGTQCTVIRLQPDYGGIFDIVSFYGDMMALCAETAGTNLLNSKLSYVFGATNKQAAESFKKIYDKIASGEPAVVFDKELLNADGSIAWQPFEQNVGQNYIAGTILDDMRKWEMKFDTDIGIPNSNTDKKERLNVNEVNSNNIEVKSKCELWLDELKKSCDATNKMFGTKITVDWRKMPESEVQNEVDTVTDGNV